LDSLAIKESQDSLALRVVSEPLIQVTLETELALSYVY